MPKVTLTFDNGPHREITPRVLDLLAHHAAKATFFVVGEKIAGNESILERVLSEGHQIGNHTFTHSGPLGLKSAEDALSEIARTDDALRFLNLPARLFRPVGGGGRIGTHLLRQSSVDHLIANHHSLVLWNSVPGDWRDPDGWLPKAQADCRSQDWTLIVLHDHMPGGLEHLEEFLSRMRAEDFEITQDIPAACMPLQFGRVVQNLDPYVTR